jgi:poly(hydroxyalkanoate) granule-associated protein
MATTPIDQPNEKEGRCHGNEVRDTAANALRGVWYASLGLAAVLGEETGRFVGTLVKKGREIEPSVLEKGRKAGQGVSDAVEDVGGKLRGLADKVGRGAELADEKVAARLKRMGFPTKEEIEELKAKIDELAAKLEEAAGKRKQPE